MQIVDELFPNAGMQTRIWISPAAAEVIEKRSRKNRESIAYLLKRLQRYAANGFALYEGHQKPIRLEWGGVYRIGHPEDLFRLIGFYEDNSRRDFIVIDAFLKTGQELTASQRERISGVAKIKKENQWIRRRHGSYPRLADNA